MRSFLILRNVYGRFAPGSAKIATPLRKNFQMGKASQFVLDHPECRAVDDLKSCLVILMIFGLQRAKGQYTMETGA